MRILQSGKQVEQGPDEVLVYLLDWASKNLPADVVLVDEGTITVTEDDGTLTSPSLQVDALTLMEDGRTCQVRLSQGVRGTRYRVAHRVQTNESPSQVKKQSFYVLIQDK